MNIQTLAQQLSETFTQQITLAAELHQVLLEENKALNGRHYKDIQQLNNQKEQHTSALEKEALKQSQLLKTAGLPYQADSFNKLLKALPANVAIKISQLKQQLESLLEKSQDQNTINGQIIAVNQQAAETALAILRGQVDDSNIGYTAGGKTVSQTTSTSITKA